jgi:[ribosomal protein S5]-alanine N-acetyltransferase
LTSLRPDAIRALLGGDLRLASRAQGLALPPGFPVGADNHLLQVQLDRVETNPQHRAWCLRAMVRRSDGVVMGHCGFHGPPDVVGRAEIGYTVLPEHRRRGYATEAVRGLVDWAQQQGQTSVFATVAPTNIASLALVRRLRFVEIGAQVDEIDGEELVFERVAVGT